MTALDRLYGGFYNSGAFSGANPGGLANGGHVTNFPAALQDIGTVAQGVGGVAAAAAASVGAAAGHAAAAEVERTAAQNAQAGAVAAKNAAEAAAASVPTLEGYATSVIKRRSFTGASGPSLDAIFTPEHGFNFSSSSGFDGPYISFGAYQDTPAPLQFTGQHIGGQLFSVRTRNLDNNTWNPWRRLWHDGNFDPASKANTASPAFTGYAGFGGGRISMGADAPFVTGANIWSAGYNFAIGTTSANNLLFFTNSVLRGYFSADGGLHVPGDIYASGSPIWHAGNFNPATKATLGTSATFAVLRADSGDGTGIVYVGPGDRYLYWNGSAYSLGGADLYINGGRAWTALDFAYDTVQPAGELKLFAANAVPSGARALIANGAAVSRSTYARLFAVIGTTYGQGDGGSTFNLPDWRAAFFRGLDLGRGIDSGRVLSTFQDSANKAHDHGYLTATAGSGGGDEVPQPGSGGVSQYGATTDPSGGSEARPVNYALLACITY